jgi:hypothetical protein
MISQDSDTELREDVQILIQRAVVLAAEVGSDLEEAVRLAAEEPLSDDEVRPLFTRIITLIRGGLDDGLDEAKRTSILQEVADLVDEVIAHRNARRAPSPKGGSRVTTSRDDGHLELIAWGGLDVRPVTPVPVFNGQPLALTEGYARTENLRLWPENHRLELHLAEFRQEHKRTPTDEELIQLLHGMLPLAGSSGKRDPFEIQNLAASIAVKGVQTPPIIDWTGELKDGNRRMAACLLILHGETYGPEAKQRAAKIRVWQTPKDTTQDQIDAIVVSLNFERDLRMPWPEYVKARQVVDRYYEVYDAERVVPDQARERALKKQVAESFAIKVGDVSRYLKMVRWAEEFEDHHRDNRNRDDATIKYRSNDLFQYFYELDAGRGEDKLGAKIRQDESFKALIFDLMFDGKFRNWTQLRDMRKVVNNEKAIELVTRAHLEPDRLRAQELISDAVFEARRNDLETKRLGVKEWVDSAIDRLDEAAPALWHSLETDQLRRFRRSLMTVEAAVAAELVSRGAIPSAGPAEPRPRLSSESEAEG